MGIESKPKLYPIELEEILNSHLPFILKLAIIIIPLFIKCTSPTLESSSIKNHENNSLVNLPEVLYRKIKPAPHLNSHLQCIFDYGEYDIVEDSDLRLVIIKDRKL